MKPTKQTSRENLKVDERKVIQKMIKEGQPASMIAYCLNRSKNAISTEIRRNGGREQYNALQAQKNSEETAKQKHIQVSNKLKGREESFGMHARIIALEKAVSSLLIEVESLRK